MSANAVSDSDSHLDKQDMSKDDKYEYVPFPKQAPRSNKRILLANCTQSQRSQTVGRKSYRWMTP